MELLGKVRDRSVCTAELLQNAASGGVRERGERSVEVGRHTEPCGSVWSTDWRHARGGRARAASRPPSLPNRPFSMQIRSTLRSRPLSARLWKQAPAETSDRGRAAQHLAPMRDPFLERAFAPIGQLLEIDVTLHPAPGRIGGSSGAFSPANGSRQAGISISRACQASTRGKSASGRPARSANGRTQATRKSA